MVIHTLVDHTRVEFDRDRSSDDLAQETRRIFPLALCRSVLHDDMRLLIGIC